MNKARLQQAEKLVAQAGRILITSHIRPDGDAIGSLLGLGLTLQAAGKQVQMVLQDGIPVNFRFLKGSEQVRTQPDGEFDLAISVDCSDLGRVGSALARYGPPDLNIDHHITNLNFGRVNLVAPEAVATAEVLADFLAELNLALPQPAAAALLTGLITDTLGFRTANITPKALRLAADLMAQGVDMAEIFRRALVNRSYAATRLWAAGLAKLNREGRMVWTSLTQADRHSVKYPGRDDADLINVLSSIEDADVAIIFVEQPNEHVKVSWRARPGVDVSQIALQFGGGGHPAASGADIPGALAQVQAAVLAAVRALLELPVAVQPVPPSMLE